MPPLLQSDIQICESLLVKQNRVGGGFIYNESEYEVTERASGGCAVVFTYALLCMGNGIAWRWGYKDRPLSGNIFWLLENEKTAMSGYMGTINMQIGLQH
jgi:hypothetical protein